MEKSSLNDIYSGLRERIESLGYDCVGFENVTEDTMKILRIYVDLPGGVSSRTARRSREVNVYLDEMERSLPERYYLKSVRPIERPSSLWRTTALFQAKKHRSDEGRQKVSGTINVLMKSKIHLLSADGEICVPFPDIKRESSYTKRKRDKEDFQKDQEKAVI